MTDAITLLGRVLLSILFIVSGWGKLMAAAATQAYFAKDGLPVPELAYAVAVLVELGSAWPCCSDCSPVLPRSSWPRGALQPP